MPDEAMQIICACEEWLMKAKTITDRFTAPEIQGGILKDHLIPKDYLALQKVCNPSQTQLATYP